MVNNKKDTLESGFKKLNKACLELSKTIKEFCLSYNKLKPKPYFKHKSKFHK